MANHSPEDVAFNYLLSLQPKNDDDGHVFEVVDDDDVSPDLEPGLRTSMCLMVDEECMRSVVERTPDSTPFLKAVDPLLATDQELDYPGVFKVSIASLITKFYPALSEYTPDELAPKTEDGIWTELGPFDREREWKRMERSLQKGKTRRRCA